ncbi:MAG TPA: hypothetical protein VFA20_14435 [Myxococcaceae bacterium]|nr:hypothetical protein [Myxococcaceae bacterium]
MKTAPLSLTTLAVLAAAALASGCLPRYPYPLTTARVAEDGSAEALVAYLGQKDASPSVCDARDQGPHLSSFGGRTRQALLRAMLDGAIDPEAWRACEDRILRRAEPKEAAAALDELAPVYRSLISDHRVETEPATVDRLTAVHRLYLDRRAGLEGDPGQVICGPPSSPCMSMLDGVRAMLAKRELGPVASRFGEELVSTADVGRGLWQGRKVDVAMMDALAAAGNEMTLGRFAQRLPDPALREEARRRIVRVHIAISPFPEVHQQAAAVEEAVLRDGHNRVSLDQHPLVQAALDPKAPIRSVVVQQHVWPQKATLLAVEPTRGSEVTATVVPELRLSGLLWAQLSGLSRAVSACGRKGDLDVDPCIDGSDLAISSALAYRAKGATFRLRDELDLGSVLPLAREASFALPVQIGGRDAVTLQWGLTFSAEPMVFKGGGAYGAGPDLDVTVERPRAERVVFRVRPGGGEYDEVVEARDLSGFELVSRGLSGSDGDDGASGSDGSSGGECQDGGPGSDGGPGGDGGPGANGGDIRIRLTCGTLTCDDLLEPLGQAIASQGGRGGHGGSGGRGGSGGSGGSGKSQRTHVDSDGNTVVDEEGCSAGSRGADGSSGLSGNDGSSGYPGRVTFIGGR